MKKLERFASLTVLAVLALLFLPAAVFGQDKDKVTEHGSIDFGVRYAEGDVYGRPDLQTGQCLGCGTPFDPSLKNSKFNEYRDIRNGFYVRRFDVKFENVLSSKNYVSLQSQKTLYRDQSYLATFGQYGKFKIQFRYDEIPHTYSDTTRTLYTQTSPGVWSFPFLLRQSLQATSGANLPNVINTQLVPQFNFITPSIVRKAGTALFSYNMNENWALDGSFWRESERGMRPIGSIMNSSPSAATSGGYGVELPEPINYFNNLLKVGTEYGKKTWAVQATYIGSFLQNDTSTLVWDNPFRTTDCVAPGVAPNTCTSATQGPAKGRMDLYPNNHANYVSVAGATDMTKYLRFIASITPGWLGQNDPFLPYTTNTALNTCGSGTQACSSLAALPASSLNGAKQTLAMNYTVVTTAWKKVELKAYYRHYDYNNNTPVHTFTPVEGDIGAPVTPGIENEVRGYNRKNLELSGEWYFAAKSDLKVGYEAEWMDRTHRDAAHSLENSVFAAVDWVPIKDLLIRGSYRHSDRKPDAYQDGNASDPTSGNPVTCADTTTVSFTADQRCARRFDEAARLMDRADYLVQFDRLQKLTLSAFGGTTQYDFNRVGGANSPVALNYLTGAAAKTTPYYLYGVLKDLSFNFGFDADYALSTQVSLFAEYSHERYYKRIISRNRTPTSGAQTILTCAGCDSANNDWESTTREPVDIYSAGTDLYLRKKVYLTTYYSLSATKGNVKSHPLGDPTIISGTNQFVLLGTNAAVDYPETVNRSHEVAVIFKFKLTEHLMPRVEYRYQQWDNKDYQTSPMTQYMGCVSPLTGAAVAGCTTRMLTQLNANDPSPVGVPSQFYPYFVVGDTSAARYLFLGVDQPSYRAHTVIATLEYSF
jgi:opacity protein-like surface antigen